MAASKQANKPNDIWSENESPSTLRNIVLVQVPPDSLTANAEHVQ